MIRPLVVDLAPSKSSGKAWAWIRDGRGHMVSESDGRWWPIDEAPGIGGRVLTRAEESALFARFGTPDAPRVAADMSTFDREMASLREQSMKDAE